MTENGNDNANGSGAGHLVDSVNRFWRVKSFPADIAQRLSEFTSSPPALLAGIMREVVDTPADFFKDATFYCNIPAPERQADTHIHVRKDDTKALKYAEAFNELASGLGINSSRDFLVNICAIYINKHTNGEKVNLGAIVGAKPIKLNREWLEKYQQAEVPAGAKTSHLVTSYSTGEMNDFLAERRQAQDPTILAADGAIRRNTLKNASQRTRRHIEDIDKGGKGERSPR